MKIKIKNKKKTSGSQKQLFQNGVTMSKEKLIAFPITKCVCLPYRQRLLKEASLVFLLCVLNAANVLYLPSRLM